jgi:hypothetical protein
VAGELDCELFLALADVHESWSCEDGEDGGYRRRRWGYREDENEDEEGGEEDYELTDLIESDLSLQHWIARDGQAAPHMSLQPSMDEVVSTLGSDDLVPVKSEHEGYMGNYGNTVDRWYHRAAVVMWPRERNFVLRAKTSPSWAVKEIASLLEAKKTAQALSRAKELLPFWGHVASGEDAPTFLLRVLTVVGSLDDAELGLALLSPVGESRLTARSIPGVVRLVERFGASWGQQLFSAWAKRGQHERSAFCARLPALGKALSAGDKHGPALARWLLAREISAYEDQHRSALTWLERGRVEGIKERADPLLWLLQTSVLIQAPDLRDRLSAFLVAPKITPPLMVAAAWLQHIHAASPSISPGALGLAPLYQQVRTAVELVLARAPRGADDWSITPPSSCSCALCEELSVFLRDPRRVEHRWPLAKDRRQHIHQRLDGHRLPVTHVTTRSGSPYTLVLTKQKALFTEAAALRAKQVELLGWLKKQRRAFEDA